MFLNTDAKYIWLNGTFQPFNDANIHLLSHTLHYGLGAFEGVRAYETESGGAIFRLRDHTERLFDAADKINITIPYSIEELEAVQKDAMTKNNLKEGYIRPIVFLGSESMGLRAKDLVSVNVAVACWEWPSYMDPEAKKKGISVIKSPYQQYDNPLYSNNKIIGTYINSIMALHDALAKNADEAILLDKNGFISEGSGENLFIVK
ncbi:MAG: aminotransferase class IV, partial [SAR86 cluster bacterium]|nr:aminotransferase class IV [SAR86 cluster bacterium]